MAKGGDPDYGRYAFFFVIFGFVITACVSLYKWLNKDDTGSTATEDRKTESEKLEDKGYKLTFPESHYSTAANSIYENLRYSSIDDDANKAEAAVLSVVFTDLDYLMLVKKYGSRQRYVLGVSVGGKTDLPTTLQDEFSRSRLERLNSEIQKRGVTYQF